MCRVQSDVVVGCLRWWTNAMMAWCQDHHDECKLTTAVPRRCPPVTLSVEVHHVCERSRLFYILVVHKLSCHVVAAVHTVSCLFSP